jgi:DNA-binding GntR family transcriptional regulator
MSGQTNATLGTSIVATLKERIIAWQYPPEHRLTEEALCREFNVSRSPVREALRVLATNGFVRRLANRGYAVRQVNLRELEELYEVRLALEMYVADALASLGAPPKALAALEETWQGVRRDPDALKGEELAELDTAFHESLAVLVGNDTLLQQLRAINERLLVFRMIDFDKPDRVESTCDQHLAILAKIAAHDASGARAAIRLNIEDARTIVQSTLKEALARAYAVQ